MEKRMFYLTVPTHTPKRVVDETLFSLRLNGADTVAQRMYGGVTLRLVVSGTDELIPHVREIGWPWAMDLPA